MIKKLILALCVLIGSVPAFGAVENRCGDDGGSGAGVYFSLTLGRWFGVGVGLDAVVA
jgi:hypothetical protein